MKISQRLDPEYQRHYEKALRDWLAGRNLREAAAIIYGGTGQNVERLIRLQEEEQAEKKKKGKKASVEGLGVLKHDGEQFVTKKRTLLYTKSPIAIAVEPELAVHESVGKLWNCYCEREERLMQELESALAEYYRELRKRPAIAGPALMPALKKNADVWGTLGKPEMLVRRRGRKVELQISWSPNWEVEHGLYVYLSSGAKIRHVGEFR